MNKYEDAYAACDADKKKIGRKQVMFSVEKERCLQHTAYERKVPSTHGIGKKGTFNARHRKATHGIGKKGAINAWHRKERYL